jgi:hypothetical protein
LNQENVRARLAVERQPIRLRLKAAARPAGLKRLRGRKMTTEGAIRYLGMEGRGRVWLFEN